MAGDDIGPKALVTGAWVSAVLLVRGVLTGRSVGGLVVDGMVNFVVYGLLTALIAWAARRVGVTGWKLWGLTLGWPVVLLAVIVCGVLVLLLVYEVGL